METTLSPHSPYIPNPVYSCGLVEDIVAEIGAQRVIVKNRKDFDTDKEDVWTQREMAKAAVCYILGMPEVVSHIGNASIHHNLYPWDPKTWVPSADYRENLISACCFLVGEIERIDRQRHASQNDLSQLPAVVIEAQDRFIEAAGGRTVASVPPMPEVVRDTLHKLGIDDQPTRLQGEEEDDLAPLPPLFTRKEAPPALKKATKKRHLKSVPPQLPAQRTHLKDNIIRLADWGKSALYRKVAGLSDLRVLFM
jgi:hypothetical protein